MIPKEKHIDVVSPMGEVLVRLTIREGEAAIPSNGSKPNKAAAPKEPKPQTQHNGETMTEAQKKYLFRLCAAQGIEGDAAHAKLKERFGAGSLADVSKFEASKMIESMLAEAKGGDGNGDGTPF